jgi:hypothetical protein
LKIGELKKEKNYQITNKTMLVKNCKGILKVGDWVRTNGSTNVVSSDGYLEGLIGEITKDSFFVWQNERSGYFGSLYPSREYKGSWQVSFDNDKAEIEIINKSNDKKSMTNLKEKFSNLFMKEPKKSFVKAGIKNNNDTLTPDGKDLFVDWLFTKHEDEFKKEVVDPLLAEEK